MINPELWTFALVSKEPALSCSVPRRNRRASDLCFLKCLVLTFANARPNLGLSMGRRCNLHGLEFTVFRAPKMDIWCTRCKSSCCKLSYFLDPTEQNSEIESGIPPTIGSNASFQLVTMIFQCDSFGFTTKLKHVWLTCEGSKWI